MNDPAGAVAVIIMAIKQVLPPLETKIDTNTVADLLLQVGKRGSVCVGAKGPPPHIPVPQNPESPLPPLQHGTQLWAMLLPEPHSSHPWKDGHAR